MKKVLLSMKTMQKKSHLSDQTKLKIVCDEVCDNIETLLTNFGLEFRSNNKMISMSCPIHGGDNISALNLYPEGETYRGNWKCRTHNCEQVFKGSVLGFIRGVISNQKYGWRQPGDDTCSFQEAVDFATAFINKDLQSIKVSRTEREKKQFTSIVTYLNDKQQKADNLILRQDIVKSLNIPAQYYIDRNYSPDILVKYDIGLCDKPSKEMYNRVVVPIYDNEYKYMVGCTGRSIFEKCSKCTSYHNSFDSCPNKDYLWNYPKWKHNTNFKTQNYLYNFWFAKKHIMESTIAIIVESPGNVWRLEENGIHNSVGIFGSSMSDRQKILLDGSGAMNLVILTDNDDAGRKACEQITKKCQNTYKIYVAKISKNDVGEMNSEEINNEIKPLLDKII
jgi:5S rRNA maturation endonuclease (ribonuclease M5)